MKNENIKVIYKTKKTTGKTVTIVFLLLLVFALSSYIGYMEYQKVRQKEETGEEQEEVEEELYYNEVMELLKKIEDYNTIFSKYYPISDFKEIDNQEKLKYGIFMLTKYENTNNYYEKKDMKRIYKENFDSNFNVIYENIMCSNRDGDLYQLKDGTYTIDRSHEHETEAMDMKTFYVESNKIDNIYKITVHLLYSDYCIGTCPHVDAYYSSYQDAVNGTNKVLDSIKDYDIFKNSLKTTTFTFEKKEDNYLLKRVSN